MAKKFSKKDLQSGNVVEYRNGKKRLVILNFQDDGDILLGTQGERFTHLDNFHDDLTHHSVKDLDIMKVYGNDLDCYYSDFTRVDECDLIWERKPVEMTIEQICKELGYDVKIIKG